MLKKIMLGSLAVAAIALNAPAAQALATTGECGFNTVAQETATGGQDTFTGVAYGYAVADPGASTSVYCEVRVNGSAVAATPAGASGQVSTSAGQVTYTASDTDNVELCAVWTDGEFCGETTTTQFPPEAVFDAIDLVFATLEPVLVTIDQILHDVTSIPDATICPIIASLSPGVPGVVDISAEGDVAVAGIGIWDCPPYEV